MNIVAIAGSTIPSDTANSLQVMKACQALVQIGHTVTLLVPAATVENKSVDLKKHYGLQEDFPIEWLSSSNRRMFTWDLSAGRARLKADLIYSWFPQSAVFGLLSNLPVVFEIHIQPTGFFGPVVASGVCKSAWTQAIGFDHGRACEYFATRFSHASSFRGGGHRSKWRGPGALRLTA